MVTINALGLAKVIINVAVCHHGVLESIIMDQSSLFTSKFWFSPCYFLEIKMKLSIAFHLKIDSQTKRQNSTIEAYFWAFVHWEQNKQARLLLMAEFAYNNAPNSSTGHILFKPKCGYNPRVSFKEEGTDRSFLPEPTPCIGVVKESP